MPFSVKVFRKHFNPKGLGKIPRPFYTGLCRVYLGLSVVYTGFSVFKLTFALFIFAFALFIITFTGSRCSFQSVRTLDSEEILA